MSNVTDKSRHKECDNSVQQNRSTLSKVGLLQQGSAIVFANKSIKLMSRNDMPFAPQCCLETDSIRSEIRQSLWERYRHCAHLVVDHHEPKSACYCLPGESVKEKKHFDVQMETLHLFSAEMFPPEEMKWLDLQKEGNVQLHRILNLPISLWYNLQYDDGQWVPRTDTQTENFTVLETYGRRTGHANVQQCLSEGLTLEAMEPLFSEDLVNYWRAAMVNGMTEGEGCTAVFKLFSDIAKLLPHVNITTPVMVYQVTSSLRRQQDKEFLISETSSMSSTEEEDRVKVSGKSKHQSKEQKDVESEDLKVRHHVDLEVACLEKELGIAKYIALIEVHSRCKPDVEAENEFLTEMISTLQAQSSVFGFLFSRDYATVYFAEIDSHGIKISKMVHNLRYGLSLPNTINVGNFQMLIMDIFSCLVVGLEKITI